MIDASLFRKLVKGWEKTREELLVVKKQARRVETRERKKFDKLVHLFYGAGGVGVWIKHFEDRHEVFVSVRMFVALVSA